MADLDALHEALLLGDRAALGRAITLVESRRAEDRAAAAELVERCRPRAGHALRLGITGIPGAGKSTLIDALGLWLIGQGHRVAVLAVDPSSARSGGSILGDKTRMERLAQRPEAFIRPTAAGGTLGGVAQRTREAIVLCEAAGYDRIVVETVGTGQNELEVDRMTDLNLLLLIAGAGDELQGIKRGIMESADAIAFTKCEGEARDRAEAARRELRGAIQLLPPRPSGRRPEALLTSALTGAGIAELGARLEALHAQDLASGLVDERRREQALHWMEQSIDLGLQEAFYADPRVAHALPALREAVRRGERSPVDAAAALLALFRTGGAPLP
ncbi:MAG: methylmalonyl Co-A mutase-associated GTPase MeaB [Flavobacteriales bacterium]|jgi:LAO/AO transport system kinase|nr:MAG: methylmalonyl Co-A mutase-associated GTPase MeaB [Flavobacteriales bacterium]